MASKQAPRYKTNYPNIVQWVPNITMSRSCPAQASYRLEATVASVVLLYPGLYPNTLLGPGWSDGWSAAVLVPDWSNIWSALVLPGSGQWSAAVLAPDWSKISFFPKYIKMKRILRLVNLS